MALPDDLSQYAQPKPSDEEYIAKSKVDALYVHPNPHGTTGKYLSYHIDEKGIDFDLSPKIRIRIYANEKGGTESFLMTRVILRKEGWTPEKDSEIKLSNFSLAKIKDFLEFLLRLDIPSVSKGRIELIDNVGDDPELLRKLRTIIATKNGKAALKKLLQEGITDEDFVNLAYRKEQLVVFDQLLNTPGYPEQYKAENEIKKDGPEAIWQFFFEKNPWIFGYGLNYVWCDGADDDRLEQVVAGFDFNSSGKRTDALMKSAGAIKQFVLVEIKTPDAQLIDKKDYGRPGVFLPGYEVVGGVAQAQKTVCKFREKFFDKVGLTDDQGNPKGEVIYNFSPRSYLIVGSLSQLTTEHGVNEEKYASFELYRTSTTSPEIITFDELYERAKAIVESGQE